jgi:hypothetical protein
MQEDAIKQEAALLQVYIDVKWSVLYHWLKRVHGVEDTKKFIATHPS